MKLRHVDLDSVPDWRSAVRLRFPSAAPMRPAPVLVLGVCAFDGRVFATDASVVPTPSFHAPACAAAAMRAEQRRVRVSEGDRGQ